MTADEILARLDRDRPLFHFADEDGVRRARAARMTLPLGEFNMAVSPGVLRWIAHHVTPDMVTLETGAGKTTIVYGTLAAHHYCFTISAREVEKVSTYLSGIGVSPEKVSFIVGSSDQTLPAFHPSSAIDFAYIDGCHGYPLPALDWHYIDKHLKIGGLLGMDNVELRPVRTHCEFLEENGSYVLAEALYEGCFVRFYQKLTHELREWIDQPYSRAKKDPCDWRIITRIRRKATKMLKPYLY